MTAEQEVENIIKNIRMKRCELNEDKKIAKDLIYDINANLSELSRVAKSLNGEIEFINKASPSIRLKITEII